LGLDVYSFSELSFKLHLLPFTPVRPIKTISDILMERRMGIFAGCPNYAVPDWIVMNVIDVAVHIFLVSDDVIPKAQLPDTSAPYSHSLTVKKPEILLEHFENQG